MITADQILQTLQEHLIFFTVFVGFTSAVLVFFVQHSRGSNSALISTEKVDKNNVPLFLILGKSNSGKTCLFQYLVECSERDEVLKYESLDIHSTTSFKMNVYKEMKLPLQSSYKQTYTIIDVPGDFRFEDVASEIVLNSSNIKGIIFMIDATEKNDEILASCNKLFKLLLATEQRNNGVDILLAVNKTEQFGARPASKFRELVAHNLNSCKKLNIESISLNESASDGKQSVVSPEQIFEVFGNTETVFKLEQLEANFDIVGGSLHKGNVSGWINWIDERAVN